jgi:hypothetical protein
MPAVVRIPDGPRPLALVATTAPPTGRTANDPTRPPGQAYPPGHAYPPGQAYPPGPARPTTAGDRPIGLRAHPGAFALFLEETIR